MGRNLIGGKNYKKTKHGSEKPAYQVKEDDQLWGRIYRILGGKNTLVYCVTFVVLSEKIIGFLLVI